MDIIPYLGYDLAAASAPSVDGRGPKPARAVSILLLLHEALDPTATSVAIRAMERTRRRHVRSPLDTATPVAIRAMERTRLRHVRSSRSLPHATSHALPRAALKLPSQEDKGRAATVGDRRGRVTSMFSIPLRARCTPRCNASRRPTSRRRACGTQWEHLQALRNRRCRCVY